MLVIIEGQRNTGKTTVINEFLGITRLRTSSLWGQNVKQHIYTRRDDVITQMADDFLRMSFDRQNCWVIDRGHISEQVYTSLTGRKVSWSPSEMSWAEYFLSLGRTLVVQFSADVDTLIERENLTGKRSEGDITEIARLFKIHMQRSTLQKVTINVEHKHPYDIAREVEAAVFYQILKWRGEEQ
jgi:AAA+ ATPase superfamily predicted ATPase